MTLNGPITVLAVEIIPSSGRELEQVLASERDITLVAEAGNGREKLLSCFRAHHPEVTLMDYKCANGGLDAMIKYGRVSLGADHRADNVPG